MAENIEGTAFDISPGWLFLNRNDAVLVEYNVNYEAWGLT